MGDHIRYYHVSHSLNSDPEFIKLRREFGDWMGFVWHEILAWGDRTGGELKGDLADISLTLARHALQMYPRRAAHRVEMALRYMEDVGWIEIRCDRIVIVNHVKYHRKRDANSHRVENNLVAPLPFPSLPLPSEERKENKEKKENPFFSQNGEKREEKKERTELPAADAPREDLRSGPRAEGDSLTALFNKARVSVREARAIKFQGGTDVGEKSRE